MDAFLCNTRFVVSDIIRMIIKSVLLVVPPTNGCESGLTIDQYTCS